MKHYVIAKFPDKESEIHPAESKLDAEIVVGNICKSIADTLSPTHLRITQKENVATVRWNGKLMVELTIAPEDEVEIIDLSKESD